MVISQKRVPDELVEELRNAAKKRWDAELAMLDLLYDHDDVFDGEKDLWKEVKFRNAAIISQHQLLKLLANSIGGSIHVGSDGGDKRSRSTKEENDATKELLNSVQKRINKKKKKWDKRKIDQHQKAFESGDANFPPYIATGERPGPKTKIK